MSEQSFEPLKLWTIQEIADITKIPRDTLQNWWKRPNQKYQMPAPFAIAGPSQIKLWSEEQVKQIKKDAVRHRAIQEANRNTRRAILNRERNKRYAEKVKKKKEEDHAKALEEAKLRIELRAQQERDEENRIFIEDFEREREEKAMQILMGAK